MGTNPTRGYAALRSEQAWQSEAHVAALTAQQSTIANLEAELRDERTQRAAEVAALGERLTEHSAALATARKAMDAMQADAERASDERRRDARLRLRVERERNIHRLESGLVVVG